MNTLHTAHRHIYMAAEGDGGAGGAPAATPAPAAPASGSGFFSSLFGGGAKGNAAPASASPASSPATPTSDPSTPALDPTTLDGFGQILLSSQASGTQAAATPSPIDLASLAGNPAVFNQLSERFDFTSNLPAEVKRGLEEGDAKAFQQAIVLSSRAAYAQALQHSAMLAGQAQNSAKPSIEQTVQQQVAQALRSHALQAAIPKEAHPATGLVLNAVASQLLSSVPNMSPEQATQAAQQILRDMGTSLAPKDPSPKGNKAWDEWMTG